MRHLLDIVDQVKLRKASLRVLGMSLERCRRSVSEIDRQTPSSWTRSQPIPTHQTLDRVQTALYPSSQQVVPHPPSAAGAIAVMKAQSDLGSQNLVTARAGTQLGRSTQSEYTSVGRRGKKLCKYWVSEWISESPLLGTRHAKALFHRKDKARTKGFCLSCQYPEEVHK
jgi:hypothetical protein